MVLPTKPTATDDWMDKSWVMMGELSLETPDEANEFFRTGVILPEKPVLRQVWCGFGLLSH